MSFHWSPSFENIRKLRSQNKEKKLQEGQYIFILETVHFSSLWALTRDKRKFLIDSAGLLWLHLTITYEIEVMPTTKTELEHFSSELEHLSVERRGSISTAYLFKCCINRRSLVSVLQWLPSQFD